MAFTVKDDQVVKRKEHSCNADESTNIILKEKAALKEIAKKSDDPLPKIYKETLVRNMQDKGLDFVADIPSFSSMKHGLYDARNKAIGAKKTVFKRVEDVEIATQFHDFLLGDYSNGKTRIIVFCTQQSKKNLTEVREGFADSTFKSCPKPFVQLLSIHGDCGSTSEIVNVKPLVFALMSDKKQSSYVALLEIIKSQIGWEITKLHCDFEAAFINAVIEVFPETSIVGCYYHWVNNIWRKAKTLKHITKEEKIIVGMSAVLPLFPGNVMLDAWAYINNEREEANLEMPKFTNYINSLLKRKHYINILSVFGQRHRTNNVVESWHSSRNRRLNKNTVTLLRLLNVLLIVDKYRDIVLMKDEKQKRKKRYIIKDDLIRRVQMQYLHNEIVT